MPMVGVGNFAPGTLNEVRNGIQAIERAVPGGDASKLAEVLEAQIVQLAEEVDRISAGIGVGNKGWVGVINVMKESILKLADQPDDSPVTREEFNRFARLVGRFVEASSYTAEATDRQIEVLQNLVQDLRNDVDRLERRLGVPKPAIGVGTPDRP